MFGRIKFDQQLLLAVAAAMCWFVQGTSQANFSSSATLPSFEEQFPIMSQTGFTGNTATHHSVIEGAVVALYELGCAFGSLSCFFIGDILGRRRMIWVAGVVVLIGTAIEASAFSIGQLIPARIIKGLGVGAFTATVPMWVSESVSPGRRGPLVLICGGFAIMGIAVMSWINVGLFLHQRYSSFSWRFPIALPALYTSLSMLFAVFLPESPRWLVKQGRNRDAYETLRKLRKGEDFSAEFEEIITAHHNELVVHDTSPFSLNQHKQLQRTILVFVLNMLAQMSGINVATFYESAILQRSGFSALDSRIFTAGMQTWQMIMAFSAIWWVSRFRRRPLFMVCAAIIMVAMACKCGLNSDLSNQKLSDAAIAFDFVIMGSFPVGLFLLPFLYSAEISGLEVRHKVSAIGSFSNWLWNFTIAMATPTAMRTVGYKYFGLYIATNATMVIFVYLFIPETKGRTLEEIDQIFINSQNPFDTVQCGRAIVDGPSIPIEPLDSNGKPFVELVEDVKEHPEAEHEEDASS